VFFKYFDNTNILKLQFTAGDGDTAAAILFKFSSHARLVLHKVY
jgi:hypothetical protein